MSTVLREMKMREKQEKSWLKIGYITKQTKNLGIKRLGIPSGFENKSTQEIWDYLKDPYVSTQWTYILDLPSIRKRLYEWQFCHYGQASENTGLERSAAEMKEDLVDLLSTLAGFLPHPYLTTKLLENTTNWTDV